MRDTGPFAARIQLSISTGCYANIDQSTTEMQDQVWLCPDCGCHDLHGINRTDGNVVQYLYMLEMDEKNPTTVSYYSLSLA